MHHLDEMVVGDDAVPGSDERLSQLALVSGSSEMSPGYLQGHFVPKIFYWIQIRRLSRPVQCCDAVPTFPFGDQFCAMAIKAHCHPETRNDTEKAVALMAPCTSVVW